MLGRNMKKLQFALLVATFIAFSGQVASAHVVVNPADVLTSSFQTFTISVPNEKEVPVTSLKLIIPEGLQSVTPTAKPSWTIAADKQGTGEDAKVKSITWAEGSLPAEFRDDFTFSAKTPDDATNLQWKVYQTYQDGSVTAWDKAPAADGKEVESADSGPLSVTKVASSLTDNTAASSGDNQGNNLASSLAGSALVVSFIALAFGTRKPAVKK